MDKHLIDERYELRDLAGSGGMADVYLAYDRVLDRPVAIKLLKARYASDEEFVERFRHEARSAASLSHPHIVPVFAWGETRDRTCYIVMEYLPGGTLKDRIVSKGTLPASTAAAVALQIGEALRAAHEHGVIHRDIKPHNILITDSGHVQVADFGIARAAETTTISDHGDILGTAHYISPEQAMGEPVSPASDLYSLGVVLYEMLTGRVPFEVESLSDLPAAHMGGPPPHPRELNPKIPEGTDALVMRLLCRDPDDRYASANHLIKDLKRVQDGLFPLSSSADGETTAALETSAASTLAAPAPGATGPHRRKWFPIVAAFALLALLSTVGATTGWNLLRDSGAASISEILRGAPGTLPTEVGAKSSEPEEVKVPGVENATEQEAQERLADAGLETEIRLRDSLQRDAGRVLEQSLPEGKVAEKGSRVLLAVGEAPEVAKVPDLVGLSYPEAENYLEESGFLLGGVQEAHSDTVPAGMIMKQDPPPGATLERNTYVYLTTSVGPPMESNLAERGVADGISGSQHESFSGASSGEAAVSTAVYSLLRRNHPEKGFTSAAETQYSN
jgi:serine/threonine protein kinase